MRRLAILATVLCLTNCNCDDNNEPAPDAGQEDVGPGEDMPIADMPVSDLPLPPDGGPDMGPTPMLGELVPLDLAPYTGNAPDPAQTARLFESTQPEDLVESPFQNALVGDWVMENDLIRVVIEGDDRVITSCPFGGHLVAGEALSSPGGTVFGEACLLINAGLTVIPTQFDVISEGGPGEAAVLAVTGTLEILDFINFPTMAEDFGLGQFGNLAVGPNTIRPLTITTYFILRPGDRAVRAVSAIRNDGEETEHVFPAYMMPTAGDGYWFNPLSSVGGWGYGDISVDILKGEKMPFLGYVGETGSYALVPEPDADLSADLPIGGVYLGLSGVVVAALNVDDLFPILLATPQRIPDLPDLVHLEPSQVATLDVSFAFGDGNVQSIASYAYDRIGTENGTVIGRVVDADGAPVEGATVTAVDLEERPFNQDVTGADGAFELTLPAGEYSLRARLEHVPGETETPVSVSAGAETDAADLAVTRPGTIRVTVTEPGGAYVPARVTVICTGVDGCPGKVTPAETDTEVEELPANWAAVEWALRGGDVVIDLPPGDYEVVVSRGIEWSIWPADATTAGGMPVSLAAGDEVPLQAEIAQVVDSTGAVGADFHVHAVSSHDSNVGHLDRVITMAVEGLDVIVSSDHDSVADLSPAVQALQLENDLRTIVGLEVTTSDIGHFNAFPLVRDPQHRRGGTVDWGGGTGPGLTPQQLFDWIDEQPGDQVIQVNHAAGLGLVEGLQADVLTGITLVDPAVARLPDATPDPQTGDTGFWSESFTAFEVFNGLKMENLWPLWRWWLTMIGRGFAPTGTAVTDTHHRYSHLGGVPRSFVFVTADTPASLDQAEFVSAINAGKLVGSSGPFFVPTLSNGVDTATMGEVIDGSSGMVEATLEIQVPAWMQVEAVDVYMNHPDVVTGPAEVISDPLPPTQTVPLTLGPADLVDAATGMSVHQRYETTVSIPLTVTADAYVVFVVRGSQTLHPVAVGTDELPFAFSNPIFVDFDGNGYDNPPLSP